MAAIKPLVLVNGEAEGLSTGDFVPVIYGGTGASTKLVAFDNLSPLAVKGDLLGFDSTNNTRLAVGTNNFALVANSAAALGFSWAAIVNTVAGRSGIITLSTTDIGGLGTMATQASSDVSITGGNINNVNGDFGNSRLLFKRSITANFAPIAGSAVDQVDLGEFYINALDQKIYTKNGDGTISSFTSDQKRVNPTSLLISPLLLDHSLKIASTEFVNFNTSRFVKASGVGVSANITLTASDVGKWFQIQNSGVVVTLPDLNTVPDGKTYTFLSVANSAITCFATQTITGLLSNSSTHFLMAGQTVTIVRNGNAWYVTDSGFDYSLIEAKANKGANSDITSLSALTYLKVDGSAASSFNTSFNLYLTDSQTVDRLSNQVLRIDYVRNSAATGNAAAFDSIINLTPTINASLTSPLYGINLEGPVVATDKVLTNYTAIHIGDSTGNVISKQAIITRFGAGNILFGKITDNGIDRLQVAGGAYIDGKIESTFSLILTGASTGLEIGSLIAPNTPYLDFHSSGNNLDYDSRIIAGGGNGVAGNGFLDYIATGGHNFKGAARITSGASLDGLVIDNSQDAIADTKFAGIKFVGTDSVFAKKDVGFLRFNPYDGNFVSSYLSIYTRFNDSVVEPLRVYGSGNVVIGDDLNDLNNYKLQIKGLVYSRTLGANGADLYTLENSSVENTLSKFAGIKFIGRDSTNTTKDSGYIRMQPMDADWVGSYLRFFTRGANTIVENMRMYGTGRTVVGDGVDDGVSKLRVYGDFSVLGKITSTGNVVITNPNMGLEIGSLTTAGTPYIDFHSSGFNNDFDARISSLGGNSTSGNAILEYQATLHSFVGRGVFSQPVLFAEGTSSVPGIAFSNDGSPDTGFYHISDGVFAVTNNTQPTLKFSPTAVEFIVQGYASSPPQFDVTTKLATTSSVYATGTHFKNEGGVGINGNISLSVASAGNWFEVQANVTVTLPSLGSSPPGITVYTFKAIEEFILKGAGSDTINSSFSSNVLSVAKGQTLQVVANGNAWYVVLDGLSQRSLGNHSSNKAFNSSVNLTENELGGIVRLFGDTPGQTASVPSATLSRAGSSIYLVNISSTIWLVSTINAQNIQIGSAAGGITSIMLVPGATIELVSDGGVTWVAASGSALTPYTQLILPSGTNDKPGLTFFGDGSFNSGFYHNNDDRFSATVGGLTIQTWMTTGVKLYGTSEIDRIQQGSVFAASGGDGGSRILLEKPITNSALIGRVVFDVFSSSVRFYDEGGTNKGAYLDLSTAGSGAGSLIYHSGNFNPNLKANLESPIFSNQIYVYASVDTGTDQITLENGSIGSGSKFSGIKFLGRDTVGTQKQVGFIRINPVDLNYVGSYMSFYSRTADTVKETLRVYGSGRMSLGGDLVDNGYHTFNLIGPQKITTDELAGLEIQSSSGNGPSLRLTHPGIGTKFIRCNSNNLEVVNDAYSAVIFAIQNSGVLTVFNSITLVAPGFVDLGSVNSGLRRLYVDYTNTATAGNVTINKAAGKVLMPPGSMTLTVTNNLVTAESIVMATISSINATNITISSVVCSEGSFTIIVSATPATNLSISYLLVSTN